MALEVVASVKSWQASVSRAAADAVRIPSAGRAVYVADPATTIVRVKQRLRRRRQRRHAGTAGQESRAQARAGHSPRYYDSPAKVAIDQPADSRVHAATRCGDGRGAAQRRRGVELGLS